jgi:hypothetical protein
MRTEHQCEHGADAARHTRDGLPLCPLCRLTHQRITQALSHLRPPALDYAALAAHDPQERDP